MNHNPKVSIVIPVYNGANYMREAIESALNQTYTNCEIIVVNDGSIDNTEEIALSYGDKIRFFSKKNGGVASALNLALQKMEGEYFSWLSHDDIYYPTKIEKQLAALEARGNMTAPLYGNWDIITMPERKITRNSNEYRWEQGELEHGVMPVLFGRIHGCAMLIHKSHFERVGVFNESLLTSQDYDMWFRIFRNQRVVYLDEPTIMSRTHNEQGSKTLVEFAANCEQIQMDMINKLNEKECIELFGSRYQMLFHMLIQAAMAKHEGNVIKLLSQLLLEEAPQIDALKDIRGNVELVLFCAGRNGRRLKSELQWYGIKVSLFTDNNQALWNTEVDGVMCVAPSQISQEAYIVVTKDNPTGMVNELKHKGYKNVVGYDSMIKKMFYSAPFKSEIIKAFRI